MVVIAGTEVDVIVVTEEATMKTVEVETDAMIGAVSTVGGRRNHMGCAMCRCLSVRNESFNRKICRKSPCSSIICSFLIGYCS